MKIRDKWRVGAWFFLILIFTVSSVALTITLLEWNMQRAQRALGRTALRNESLSRYSFTFLQELTRARIQEAAYAEADLVVEHVVDQYLSMITSVEKLRYLTDTVLGIEPAKRPLTLADQEIIKSLNAELNANPSVER